MWASLLGGLCVAGVVNIARAQQRTPAKPAPASEAAPGKSGPITGVVTVPAGHPLPEMVVYLESPDPKFTFAPPKEPR